MVLGLVLSKENLGAIKRTCSMEMPLNLQPRSIKYTKAIAKRNLISAGQHL
jgi:hypothetical protein